MVRASPGGLRRAMAVPGWRAIAVGAVLFLAVRVPSPFLYPDGVPENVVGLPLPFVYRSRVPPGGPHSARYPALAIDPIAWTAIGIGLSVLASRRTADP